MAQRRPGRGGGRPRVAAREAGKASRLGRWARIGWGVVAALGLVSLVAGTVYAVRVEPWVKDRLVGESRLRVDRLTQTQFTPLGVVHGGVYLFPDDTAAPADVPAGTLLVGHYPAYEKWAEGVGGVPAYTVSYRLVIRAVDEAPVLINGIRVDVVSRDEPPSGWFRMPEAACGVQPVRLVALDLDQEPVRPELVVRSEDTLVETRTPYAQTLRVTLTDPEVLEIVASSRRDDVRFTITLLYQSDRGSGEHVVEPLRVTALRPGRAQAYDRPPDPDAVPSLVRAEGRDPDPNGTLGFC